MAKRIIEIEVNDEYVLGSGVMIGAAGSHDDVTIRVKFNDAWIGLSLYATFRNAKGENPTLVAMPATMLVDGEVMTYDVDIPRAAKLYEGRATLTFTGYTIANGTREDTATNTATAFFRVLPSDFAFADDGSVDSTLAQQLLKAIDDHVADVTDQLEEVEDRVSVVEAGETARTGAELARAEAELAREAAEEKRNETIGDVAEALKAILAYQNALLEGYQGSDLPVATIHDNGKIIEVVDGEYELKKVEESSINTYVDEYISGALGGDY